MTYRANCLLGAGSFSAGTILGFNAITADYRTFAGVCTIAVRCPLVERMRGLCRRNNITALTNNCCQAVAVVFSTVRGFPICNGAIFILTDMPMGGFIVLPISREAMTFSRNYFRISEFTVNRRCAVVIIRKQRMPVVDRYGHFGGVA